MNLTNQEEKVLQDILKDDSIIIRPADGGSGIVIVDSDQYFKYLTTEVENNDTYLQTKEDKTKTIMKKLKVYCKECLLKDNYSRYEELFDT